MTRGAFNMPNLPHKVTIMIINAGQKSTVSYSDIMCDLNCPNSEKIVMYQKSIFTSMADKYYEVLCVCEALKAEPRLSLQYSTSDCTTGGAHYSVTVLTDSQC